MNVKMWKYGNELASLVCQALRFITCVTDYYNLAAGTPSFPHFHISTFPHFHINGVFFTPMISAPMLTAISSGVRLLIASPMGLWICCKTSSAIPSLR